MGRPAPMTLTLNDRGRNGGTGTGAASARDAGVVDAGMGCDAGMGVGARVGAEAHARAQNESSAGRICIPDRSIERRKLPFFPELDADSSQRAHILRRERASLPTDRDEPAAPLTGTAYVRHKAAMSNSDRAALGVSSAWIQVAILTFVVGFGILGYLAYRVYAEHPPVPGATVAEDGAVLFTRDDVFRGQLVFGRYGLMEYGTIFGHGAYLGPDFTADYIERAREVMQRHYAARGAGDAAARVLDDFKVNR